MGAEGVNLAPEGCGIVTTIETGSATGGVGTVKIGAEVGGEERCPETIEGGMIEGTVQLASLAREQHTSDPDIDHLVELKLADRIEQADRGIASKILTTTGKRTRTSVHITIEAVRVELKLHILVDLAVDVD